MQTKRVKSGLFRKGEFTMKDQIILRLKDRSLLSRPLIYCQNVQYWISQHLKLHLPPLNAWEEKSVKHNIWHVLESFMNSLRSELFWFYSGSTQYILTCHLLWFIYILLNSVFVHFQHSKDFFFLEKDKNSTTTKSLEKMFSDEMAKKKEQRNQGSSIPVIQPWQLTSLLILSDN